MRIINCQVHTKRLVPGKRGFAEEEERIVRPSAARTDDDDDDDDSNVGVIKEEILSCTILLSNNERD